jgi:hypothetical protein
MFLSHILYELGRYNRKYLFIYIQEKLDRFQLETIYIWLNIVKYH